MSEPIAHASFCDVLERRDVYIDAYRGENGEQVIKVKKGSDAIVLTADDWDSLFAMLSGVREMANTRKWRPSR